MHDRREEDTSSLVHETSRRARTASAAAAAATATEAAEAPAITLWSGKPTTGRPPPAAAAAAATLRAKPGCISGTKGSST